MSIWPAHTARDPRGPELLEIDPGFDAAFCQVLRLGKHRTASWVSKETC